LLSLLDFQLEREGCYEESGSSKCALIHVFNSATASTSVSKRFSWRVLFLRSYIINFEWKYI
jgi:hypothetical protein